MKALRRAALAALLLGVCAPAPAIDARIAARVAGEGPFWVGQRIVVEVDLLSSGFSFSGQRFDLPDPPGVVLLPPGSATLNLSERVGGETWQGLRYELSLFVFAPGTLDVAPITASFAVAAGYGRESKEFRLETGPLRVEVRLPPGVRDAASLVTTPEFEFDARWEPQPQGLKVGDALTLTLRRSAEDVPGAAIPPLEHATPSGLAAYPGEPEIADRTGRGALVGERVDRITYVLQAPGEYRLPGRSLYWFDPHAGRLHEETVAPLAFSVAPNPDARVADRAAADAGTAGAGSGARGWIPAAAGAMLALGAWAARRLGPAWRRRRAARAASEAGRFDALLTACRRGDPVAADRALRAWLRSIGSGATTATAFAAGDPAFANAVADLQAALAGARRRWSGGDLATALRAARRHRRERRAAQVRRPLPPLNPEGTA